MTEVGCEMHVSYNWENRSMKRSLLHVYTSLHREAHTAR